MDLLVADTLLSHQCFSSLLSDQLLGGVGGVGGVGGEGVAVENFGSSGSSSPGRCWGGYLGPHPAERYPEGFPLQPFQDTSEFCTGAGRVLLDQDPVHQVSVLLIDLSRRLAHLLEIFVLSQKVTVDMEPQTPNT